MITELQRILFSICGSPAYLDPGSGSILLQLIIAGLLGFGVFIGSSWKKIIRFFRRKKEDDPEKDE